VPVPLRDWKLPPARYGDGARWLRHDPALARALLAEAGFAEGLRVRCVRAPGLDAEQARDLARLAASLHVVGVELHTVDGPPGRLEDASWGPSERHADVDGYLYDAYRSGEPGNRSRVADPALDALLEAQRALAGPARRRAVADIQRLVTDRVYYVYTPCPRRLGAWAARLRGYRPGDSLDRGAELAGVSLTREVESGA
jgi:ABC-type transport system substrate-binding protein